MTLHFRDWLLEEAALIHADGCTGVTNYQRWCCLQHDLEFYYGKSAVDAFRRYKSGVRDPWMDALIVTFDDANQHFRRCHFREGLLGHWNPIAWVRYFVVMRRRGRAAWGAHRRREQVAA